MKLFLVFLLFAAALSVALGRRGVRSAAARVPSMPEPRPERLLIVGATGGTGRQLVEQALERGYTVTALARDPSTLRMDHPRLTVVQGNVLDYPSVEAAVRGQDAVVSALGHRRYFGPSRILSQGTRNLLRAMETHRIQRFVCETALGIGDSAGRMGVYYTFLVIPIVLPFYFWDKTRQERLIAASRVPWVVVRPGALTNGAKRGGYRHGQGVGSFLRTVRISRADVADFMLNQLTANTYLRDAVGVCW
jgi:putative NADH-flavin reductase